MIISGRHPVSEALSKGLPIEKILLQAELQGHFTEIIQQARHDNIIVQFVPKVKLDKLVHTIHQGIIAFTSEVKYHDLQSVIDEIQNSGKHGIYILFDGITDVRNLGAIARTAYGMGVDALILPTTHSAPVNDVAIKTSAGALQHITICKSNNLITTIKDLKANNIFVIGIDTDTNHNIQDIPKNISLAIVIGDEGKGISSQVKKLLNSVYAIPIQNGLDSYNVSVATAIALYEIRK